MCATFYIENKYFISKLCDCVTTSRTTSAYWVYLSRSTMSTLYLTRFTLRSLFLDIELARYTFSLLEYHFTFCGLYVMLIDVLGVSALQSRGLRRFPAPVGLVCHFPAPAVGRVHVFATALVCQNVSLLVACIFSCAIHTRARPLFLLFHSYYIICSYFLLCGVLTLRSTLLSFECCVYSCV